MGYSDSSFIHWGRKSRQKLPVFTKEFHVHARACKNLMHLVAGSLNDPYFDANEIKKVRNVFKFKSILIYSTNKTY